MAKINLLPWREEQRQERQRQFMVSALLALVMSVVFVFLVGTLFDQRISHQNARNQRLEQEIGRLKVRIQRIEQLEQTRSRLLSRKAVIEELQASRSLTVEMLDQLSKTIPVGVTLDSIIQQGQKVTLAGSSQSNARVSAYLQSLQANDLFLEPELGVVRLDNSPATSVEPYDYSISIRLRTAADEAEEEALEAAGTGGAD